MPIQLSEALVLGLLTDLETRVPAHEAKLVAARKRAQSVEAELVETLKRYDAAQHAVQAVVDAAAEAAHAISEGNVEIGKLKGELGPLQRRSDNLRVEMQRYQRETPEYRELRRQRAVLGTQMETRNKKVAAHGQDVQEARMRLAASQESEVVRRDVTRTISNELDVLQAQLPEPKLLTDWFELRAARAHCRVFLDRDVATWGSDVIEASRDILSLHEQLRDGRYRLDNNSELVGGRATATAEAIHACVALGQANIARQLFTTATHPSLFFHHIFNVYRVWSLGLYLIGDAKQLVELLDLHRDSQGSRGAYARAFLNMLMGDAEPFRREAALLVHYDWEQWSRQRNAGLGVINVTALALHRMAREQGLGLSPMGPSVPAELLQM